MPVFDTDSVTIVRKKDDLHAVGSTYALTAEENVPSILEGSMQSSIKLSKNNLENRKMMLIIAAETATVLAQEQRAKDAKSFRRLYASDYNSMLIS